MKAPTSEDRRVRHDADTAEPERRADRFGKLVAAAGAWWRKEHRSSARWLRDEAIAWDLPTRTRRLVEWFARSAAELGRRVLPALVRAWATAVAIAERLWAALVAVSGRLWATLVAVSGRLWATLVAVSGRLWATVVSWDVPGQARRFGRAVRAASTSLWERLATRAPVPVPSTPTVVDGSTGGGKLRSLVSVPVLVAGIALLGAVLASPAVVAAHQLVSGVSDRMNDIPPMPEQLARPAERSLVMAADGSHLASLFEENREIIPLDRVPEHVRQAVLAIEDVRFYEHEGVDVRGTARALVANLRTGRISEGGSTITQQYVKNVLLSHETTLERKIVEALYAVDLERRTSKDEVLEGYLNVAYFGRGVYGIAAAAQFFFGVEVEELTISQAATLAGVLANPTRFDPVDNGPDSQARRDIVLGRMQAAGFITAQEADEARAEEIEATPHPLPETVQPFFVEYVKQLLLADPALGETREERARVLFRGGVTVETTLDPKIQDDAVVAIAAYLEDPVDDPLGAVVSVDPRTGEIKAMATGPREFGTCPEDDTEPCPQMKVNPVAPGMGGSGRQAGSAFKPILAAAALDQGIPTSWHARAEPGQTIPGCGAPGEPWEPRNYSDGRAGTMDMVDAMRVSNNVYHALLIAEVGPPAVVDMAERLGFTRGIPAVCAIALGAAEVFPLEMASAFGAFANDGVHCKPYAVTRVVAPDGSVLLENEPDCERVMDEKTAATMTSLLRNVITGGTGTAAAIGRDAAGKTGTTDDHRDAWFVGYVPQLATAAWVGYELPREMAGILGFARITGGSVPARIWSTYMRSALDGVEVIGMPHVTLDRYTPPRPRRTTRPSRDRDESSDRPRGRGSSDRDNESPPPDDDDD